ncbi:Activity-dependent neuroprotector homeobox protein [Fagus crenata]
MASDSSKSWRHDIGNEELEELEVIEIDGALLRSLLEESENEDAKQSLKVENVLNNMIDERKGCLEQHAPHIHDFDGLDMMEMAPMFPSDDMVIWYVDDPVWMINFGYDGGVYSEVHDGFSSNETTYNCLWEDF